MTTTHEKLNAIRDEVALTPPEQMPEDARGLVAGLQMLAGMSGIDVFDYIVPDDPAEADVLIDKLLDLAFHLRGDDLAPYRLPAGVQVTAFHGESA